MSRIDDFRFRLESEIDRLRTALLTAPAKGCWVAFRKPNLALTADGRLKANTLGPATAPTYEVLEGLIINAGFEPMSLETMSLRDYYERVIASKTQLLEKL